MYSFRPACHESWVGVRKGTEPTDAHSDDRHDRTLDRANRSINRFNRLTDSPHRIKARHTLGGEEELTVLAAVVLVVLHVDGREALPNRARGLVGGQNACIGRRSCIRLGQRVSLVGSIAYGRQPATTTAAVAVRSIDRSNLGGHSGHSGTSATAPRPLRRTGAMPWRPRGPSVSGLGCVRRPVAAPLNISLRQPPAHTAGTTTTHPCRRPRWRWPSR